MKLQELINNYSNIEIATSSHNKEILTFFDKMAISGTELIFRYERSPNYFKFLDFSSKRHFTFICRDKKNNIGGIGSLVIRKGYIKGEVQNVGYLGDLRIRFKKEVVVTWRKFYTELLEKIDQIEEFGGLKYLYTAVIDDNKKASNALIKSKKNKYIYNKITNYKMVNILGQSILSGIKKYFEYKISQANDSEYPEIKEFLDTEQSKKSFGYFNGKEGELDYRFENWSKLKTKNFIIARDVNRKIAGVFSLWSPSPTKKIIIEKLPLKLRFIIGFLSLVKSFPKPGEELKVLYINNLEFAQGTSSDKKLEIFLEMLSYVYKNNLMDGYHILSFADFPQYGFYNRLRGFISNYEEMSLYTVAHKENIPRLLSNKELGKNPPGFEMSLV